MSDISEIYIDELKNVSTPIVKRHSFRAVLIAATLAVVIVCTSLFALIGSNPPEIPSIPYDFSESNISNSSDKIENSNNLSFVIDDSTGETSVSHNESSFGESSSNKESSWNPPNIDENGAEFTAQQIADIFAVREDIKTNQYMTFSFDNVSDIQTTPLPQSDLPILFERDWKYKFQKFSLGGSEEYAIYIDDKTIILPEDVSYDEVYGIAIEWLPHCQEYFGFEYSDIKVNKSDSTVRYEIIYYDSTAIYPYFVNGKPIIYTNSYVRLQIGSNIGNSDIITLMLVSYKAENDSFYEGESYNTISLQEAEKMLNNGYVFGGHTCRLCMQEQEKVDFSDYDHVGIEYVQKATYEEFTNEYYPFYAFYKEIGDGLFARTYVPAFRVSGLEEFFESQESKHNSSGLIQV